MFETLIHARFLFICRGRKNSGIKSDLLGRIRGIAPHIGELIETQLPYSHIARNYKRALPQKKEVPYKKETFENLLVSNI